MEQKNNDGLKLFLNGAKANYDTIANADNALDGKAGTLMGIEIAFGIGYIAIFFNSLTSTNILGLTLLAISVVLLLIINWPRIYLPFSVSLFQKPEYLEKTGDVMLVQLISDGENALEKNSQKLKFKVLLYEVALALLIVSSLLLILKIDICPTTNKAYPQNQASNQYQHQYPHLNSLNNTHHRNP